MFGDDFFCSRKMLILAQANNYLLCALLTLEGRCRKVQDVCIFLHRNRAPICASLCTAVELQYTEINVSQTKRKNSALLKHKPPQLSCFFCTGRWSLTRKITYCRFKHVGGQARSIFRQKKVKRKKNKNKTGQTRWNTCFFFFFLPSLFYISEVTASIRSKQSLAHCNQCFRVMQFSSFHY